MNLRTNKMGKENTELLNNCVAVAIAKRLSWAQQYLAVQLNNGFNALSNKLRKLITIGIGLIVTATLVMGLFSSSYHIPRPKQFKITTAHIGQPSGLPPQQRQFRDSLTLKIKSWKQTK